jgi:hypothetical protein
MNRVESGDIGLYLLFKLNYKKDNYSKWEIRKMKTDDDLAKDILGINSDFLKSIINQKSLDVIEYTPGSNTDKNIVEKSNVDNLPKFDEIKDLLNRNATSLPSDSKVKYYKPIAYIFKLDTFADGTHDKSIISFQYLLQQKTLKKGKLFGRYDDTFKRMDDDLFYMGVTLDALYCEDKINDGEINMYIFNKQHIDWIFGFGDVFKEEIRTKFNENKEEYDKLIDIGEFTKFVLADYQFVRKTYKVLKNKNFEKYFNKETILKVEEEANISKLEWEAEKLVVNSDNVKKILDIVNEDYLKSVVSENVYRSLSKTSVE